MARSRCTRERELEVLCSCHVLAGEQPDAGLCGEVGVGTSSAPESQFEVVMRLG